MNKDAGKKLTSEIVDYLRSRIEDLPEIKLYVDHVFSEYDGHGISNMFIPQQIYSLDFAYSDDPRVNTIDGEVSGVVPLVVVKYDNDCDGTTTFVYSFTISNFENYLVKGDMPQGSHVPNFISYYEWKKNYQEELLADHFYKQEEKRFEKKLEQYSREFKGSNIKIENGLNWKSIYDIGSVLPTELNSFHFSYVKNGHAIIGEGGFKNKEEVLDKIVQDLHRD